MRYIIDNDLHIHSKASLCSKDPEQTPERILQYAKDNNLKTICLTDHFWDEAIPCDNPVLQIENYRHNSQMLPLPQAEGIRFLFGCETEIRHDLTLGLAKEHYDLFDFIVIPTTHYHNGFTFTAEELATPKKRAIAWVSKLDAVLNMDLPFHKVGIAHLTCGTNYKDVAGNFADITTFVPDEDMTRIFTKAASLGVGIELNAESLGFACDGSSFTDEQFEIELRPYRKALECGCKFYCGSDAHHPKMLLEAKEILERAIDRLGLTEEDKFII